MDANIASRFAQETRSLGEEGRRFAVEYPEAAKFLDVANVDDRDPYVERLLESFVFLTSRSREATEAMQDGMDRVFLDLIGGDLEEAIPAVMVVEFLPRRSLSGTETIDHLQVLESGPVRNPVRWSLLTDHPIHPLVLRTARVHSGESSPSVLEWSLEWFSPSVPDHWPESLRFYLHGDAAIAWALRFFLLRRLDRVEMLGEEGRWVPLPKVRLKASRLPGFASQGEASHPYAKMRDFLCSDEQARFLELEGLESIALRSPLSLRFHFQEQMPRVLAKAVQAGSFRLHAAITINRFDDGHCTLHCDHTKSEYILRPEGGGDREILNVLAVDGIENRQVPTRIRYQPHGAFRHGQGEGRFFRARRGKDRWGAWQFFLSVAHRDPSLPFEDTYLAVTAQFCDGNRPYELGTVRDLRAKSLPRGVGVSALSRPGIRLAPPEHLGDTLRLHPLAAVHFQGLLDVHRLRDLLRLWLWDPTQAKAGLVDSLRAVSAETGYVWIDGVAFPVQTVHLRLRDTTCAADTWERLGAIDAFGAALAELFSGQGPLGFRSRLVLEVEPCGVVLEFGQRC